MSVKSYNQALDSFNTETNNAINSPTAATTATNGSVKMATAIADLAQVTTNPPTQAEVQAIADKVDALLAVMRTAGQLAP